MNDDNDLSSTIVAKSDQMNADELLEPVTITITRVEKVTAKDQPVHIHSEGRQPYKPCLTMRRMLIAAWGKYADAWVGQSMTLYNDPSVRWAGKAQGGIRISHVTGILQPVKLMLAVSRGKKAEYTLLALENLVFAIQEYTDATEPERTAMWPTLSPAVQAAITDAFNNQKAT